MVTKTTESFFEVMKRPYDAPRPKRKKAKKGSVARFLKAVAKLSKYSEL